MKMLLRAILVVLLFAFNLFCEDDFKPKVVYLTFDLPKKQLYTNQVFAVDFKAIIASESVSNFYSIFPSKIGIEILNPRSNWTKIDEYAYTNRYYFKIKSKLATLPKVEFYLNLNDGSEYVETVDGFEISSISLNAKKDFSGVIASNLDVKNYKTTKYDEKNNILVLEIDANESNLEDFRLRFEKQGIDSIERDLPFTKVFYYALISQKVDSLNFEYFNTKTNKYIPISLPIFIEDDKTVNQSDLDPQDTNLKLYKVVGLSTLLAIFIIIFAIKRGRFNLFMIVVLSAIIIYDLIPNRVIKLQKECKIRLLPTKNSTIFMITNREISAEFLSRQNGYMKVLLPDNNIGWVDEKCGL